MPILKTEGLIISSLDFRQTSRIFTFFTQDYGKIKGIVKGIRKDPLKYFSSGLLFSLNQILFYPSRSSELVLVSFIEYRKVFPLFKELDSFLYACFFCLLVDKILPLMDKNVKVYNLLLWSFENLSSFKDKERIKINFIMKLLEYTGFQPHILSCLVCKEPLSLHREVYFSVEKGGLICDNCKGSKNMTKISRGVLNSLLFIQTHPLDKILVLNFSKDTRQQISQILDNFIIYHLDVKPSSIFI